MEYIWLYLLFGIIVGFVTISLVRMVIQDSKKQTYDLRNQYQELQKRLNYGGTKGK